MKIALTILLLLMVKVNAMACPACKKQQPGFLSGISHGRGPDSNWDYVMVAITVFVVILTMIYTVKWLVVPGEKNSNHIKRTVLN